MHKYRLAVATTFFITGGFAQTPSVQTDQAQKQVAPCTVSGRVVSAAEGAPIQSARVALVQEHAKSRGGIFGASTDKDGHFEIKLVLPGRYYFFASHAGYISRRYQAQGMEDGAVLALTPGQEIADVMFRLVRAAAITGRVIDESGEPMVGVSVSALRKPTTEEKEDWNVGHKETLVSSSTATTDDRGEYRVFGLKPGEYYLKASDMSDPRAFFNESLDAMDWTVRHELGSQYAPLYYPGVIQLDQAQPVTLRAGEDMQADFAMRHMKTVTVSGRVVAPDGGPATHAFVGLTNPEVEDWSQELNSFTDSKGEFSIKGVPPGSYVLSAQQRDQDRHYMTRMKLNVGEEKIDSLTVAFGRGVTIHGRITVDAGAPTFDRTHIALLSVADDVGGGFSWAEVKKDGSFQLNDVADGSYALQVSGVEQGWFTKSARLGAEDVYQKGVQVEQGNSGGSLEIILSSAGAQLEGSVADHDKPVAGAQVRVKPDPETQFNRNRSRSTSTDQNGHFSFDVLPPGKYRVIARLPSAAPEVPAVSSEPKAVMLNEHDHQTLQLTLETPPTQ
jgi:protocatechuate 3,4-dioxygenase beta subunit